ncbi:MAG: PAS domain S-box protein, partial [Candidatus Paceibacterota bacterium]
MASDDSLHILVIEDDADTQANIRDILALDGYCVSAASTCAEALDRECWDDVSAILLDRKLPDGTAEEILPRLRQLAPHAQIVVVTGFPDVESTIGALREGAYDYLLKPINPDALRASLRRIAERKRIEQSLRESEQRMRVILNTAADAIITIDQRGIVQSVNAATVKMFGYSRDELVGHNIKLLMPPPYHDEHDGYITRYLETGEARILGIGREMVGRHQDGSRFPIGLTVSEVDHLGLFTGIVRDISAMKELQKQVLEIAAEENRRIGHELHDNIQQQLTGLGLLAKTVADRLKAGATDASFSTTSDMAAQVATGIKEAANQVHLLSHGLVPVEVDAEGLRSALANLASRINEQYGMQCDFHCAGVVEVSDNFVATHLYRIAQEAVNNATKHGRAKRIEISLTEVDEGMTMKVLDNGSGIGARFDAGSGMGLQIMQYRAGLIGATLRIGSGEDGGTQVICTALRGGGG